MAGSFVMLRSSQCESRRALSGLATLSRDHVMNAEETTHQTGKKTMAESTFMLPMAEESTARRFMLLLNHPLAL